MAESLKTGYIDAYPTDGACTYCRYGDICRREEDGSLRETEKFKFKDAIEMLGGDGDEQVD